MSENLYKSSTHKIVMDSIKDTIRGLGLDPNQDNTLIIKFVNDLLSEPDDLEEEFLNRICKIIPLDPSDFCPLLTNKLMIMGKQAGLIKGGPTDIDKGTYDRILWDITYLLYMYLLSFKDCLEEKLKEIGDIQKEGFEDELKEKLKEIL